MGEGSGGASVKPSDLAAWREAAGGRRFLMCMGASLVNTGLFACGPLSEQGYLTAFGLTVGAYLAAAGWQKHMQARTSNDFKQEMKC